MLKTLGKSLLPRSAWALAQRARRRLYLLGYSRRWIERPYDGTTLRLLISDPVAEEWYDREWPPQCEFALLRRHRLRPGAQVFNVGAHQAVVALILAAAVGTEGRVIAVEPSRHNVRVARRNLRANGGGRVRLVRAVVADAPGTVLFSEGLNGKVSDGVDDWGLARIPSVTIDDLTQKYGRPDVLFIDVEGFEARALRGASQTLRQFGPDCFVEVHVGQIERYGDSADDVLAFFPPASYSLFVAAEQDREFRPLEAARHMLVDRFFLIAVGKA